MLKLILASLVTVVFVSIADARPHHADWSRYSNHWGGYHHYQVRHSKVRHYKSKKYRYAKASKAKRAIYRKTPKRKHHFYAPQNAYSEMAKAAEKSPIVAEAKKYLGQTARQIGLSRATLWCSTFLREKIIPGLAGINDLAKSWLIRPHVEPEPGVVAVLTRGRRGGHVGIVLAIRGKWVALIQGNGTRSRVTVSWHSTRKVIAYVAA